LSTAPATTRHERRRQETADRIAAAAAALFGERGVEATTVADVCERADVARQTFFNHFGSKQELVRGLAHRGHDFFVEAVEAAILQRGSTRERLTQLFESVHVAAASVGPMHQDLLSATIDATYEADDPADIRGVHRSVEKLIRRGRAAGDVSRRHALEDQAILVLGALHDLQIAWTHQSNFPIAERSARMARMLAEVLAPRADE
jgi:AcrR family transcriptional regulator